MGAPVPVSLSVSVSACVFPSRAHAHAYVHVRVGGKRGREFRCILFVPCFPYKLFHCMHLASFYLYGEPVLFFISTCVVYFVL